MTITITVFESSPDCGRGLARDMAVRWALEEVGQPYAVRGLSFEALKQPQHRARQPFGQIPSYEEGDLVLFESGAIVLHIAERYPGLLPENAIERARATGWMVAALSTIEPPILDLQNAIIQESDRVWHADRLPIIEDRIRQRLDDLTAWFGDQDWLEGAFSVGDLLMIAVLRRLSVPGRLDAFPRLAAYVARGEGRPAFRRAFDAQRALFLESQAGPSSEG